MNALSARLTDCEKLAHSVEPYADGELDPCHAMDVESHLASCSCCAERVVMLRAVRKSLKRSSHVALSETLRAKVCASMVKEKQEVARREDERRDAESGGEHTRPRLIGLQYAMGLAAAAGVVFAIGVWRHQGEDATRAIAEGATSDVTKASLGLDGLVDNLVALHADPLPPETTNPEELPRLGSFVGVPVKRPVAFQPLGARFTGARVNAMSDRRAAVLLYTIHGHHRITMYVFDSRSAPVQKATQLRPRIVLERPVYVGRARGYSVAAVEQGGVGYAIASDLDDDESAHMMAAAFQP